jgi:hypothetical protein
MKGLSNYRSLSSMHASYDLSHAIAPHMKILVIQL